MQPALVLFITSATNESSGTKAIIGASCYNSKHLAMEAAEKGADYVAFGAFFEIILAIPTVAITSPIAL